MRKIHWVLLGASVLALAAVAFLTPARTVTPGQLNTPGRTGFRYELAPPPTVLTVGEPIHVEWVAHPDSNYALATDTTLCFALMGPWPDADSARQQIQATQPREWTCPVPGAAVMSPTVQVTAPGASLKADIAGVMTPGFYNLRQMQIARLPSGSFSGSFDRIVEVRAAR